MVIHSKNQFKAKRFIQLHPFHRIKQGDLHSIQVPPSLPYLPFISVNRTNNILGIAKMMSTFEEDKSFDCWFNDGYTGSFQIKWIYIKDVDFAKLNIKE